MKIAKIILTTLLITSVVIHAEELVPSNIDEEIFANFYLSSQEPSLAKGRMFLDDALTTLKNGSSKNPDTRDEWQNTPLMWAVGLRDIEAVEYLLAHGADVEAINNEGANPFAWLFFILLVDSDCPPEHFPYNLPYDNKAIAIIFMLANNNPKALYKTVSCYNIEATPLSTILALIILDLVQKHLMPGELTETMIYLFKKNNIIINHNVINDAIHALSGLFLEDYFKNIWDIKSFVKYMHASIFLLYHIKNLIHCSNYPSLNCNTLPTPEQLIKQIVWHTT